VPIWDEKVRVTVGGVSLELPVALVKRQDGPIDSAAAVYEGHGVTVIVDQSPFSDRLDSHVGAPEYEEHVTDVGGAAGRLVSFRSPEDGTYTVATHLHEPTPLTVVVRADDSVPEEVVRGIVGSLRLHG
jgi:hypothetical protein